MKATKNAHDWHCHNHDTYGWRGEECKQCPVAPSEIEALQAENAALKIENENLLAAGKFTNFQADKYLKEVDSLKEQVAQLQVIQDGLHRDLDYRENEVFRKLETITTLQSKSAALVDALERIGDTSCGEASHQYIALTALADFKGEK